MKKSISLVLLICAAMTFLGVTAGTKGENNQILLQALAVDCIENGELDAGEAFAYLVENPDTVIVDVSTLSDYEEQKIEGAIRISAADISRRESNIPVGARVLLYGNDAGTVGAVYSYLLEYRSDLNEVSFLSGSPWIEKYNQWVLVNR